MKSAILSGIGAIASVISAMVGGFSQAVVTLLIFMCLDYITGLIVAGVFHKSQKTPNGGLESRAGWKGLIRKGVTLTIVMVAARIGMMMGNTWIRDGVVIAFIVNETISIIENAALMGVPVPRVLQDAIEVLQERVKEHDQDLH